MSSNIRKKAKEKTLTISLILGDRFMKYGTMYKKQENGESLEYEVEEELALELLELVNEQDIPRFKEIRKPTKPSVKPVDLSKETSTNTDKKVAAAASPIGSEQKKGSNKQGAVKV